MRLVNRILDIAGVAPATLYEYRDGTQATAWEVCAGWLAEVNRNVGMSYGDDTDDWDARTLANDFEDYLRETLEDGTLEDVVNNRILQVLCDLADTEGEDDPVLADRVHEIMDAINERRI